MGYKKAYEKEFKLTKTAPRFKEGDRVVLVRQYPEGCSQEPFENGELCVGVEYWVSAVRRLNCNAWRTSGIDVLLEGANWFVDQDMLALVDEEM